MKLRDHPLLTRKSGFVNWPPQWLSLGWAGNKFSGEVGVLEDVSMHRLITNKIFIAARHREERYIAVLAFDDETFAQQLYQILLQNVDRSIKEIGDLDLSHLL